MSGHIHWSKACTQSRLYVHICTYNDKLRPPTRSASSGQINSIVTLRKWTFTVTADACHELWAPTQAHYLRKLANDSEEELNSRLLGNTGGGLHVNAMCHLHLPVCLAFSIISFVIHSVAFSLFVSSHICLVSFPRPQSNRFFFERPSRSVGCDRGAGQEEVGDKRIAFPCVSPLPALGLSIQLLLKQHTPTWAGAIHTRLFGGGLSRA